MKKLFSLGILSLILLITGVLYADGPSALWTRCSAENQTCMLGNSVEVAYGANGYFSYITVSSGTPYVSCTNSTFGGDPVFGTVKACYKKIVAVNLPWFGRQGTSITESQSNGFAIAAGTSKDISVWSECQKVTATTKNVFVPTLTQNEWNKFKAGAGSVGASLSACAGGPPSCNNNGIRDNGETGVDCGGGNCGACGSVVTGVCSTVPGSCSAGTVTNDNGLTTPGSTRTWLCLGSGGGGTDSCSYLNSAASCNYNGVQDNGESGVDCGGGNCAACSAPVTCGSANGGSFSVKPTANLCSDSSSPFVAGSGPWSWSCGSNSCSASYSPAACVPNGSYTYGSCSGSCGPGNGTQNRYDSCGSSAGSVSCTASVCPPNPTTGPYTYGGWGACSVTACGTSGTQTRSETCNYDTCTGRQSTSQSCNTAACASCGGAEGSRSTNPLTDGSTNLCSVGSASNGAHTANPSWIVGTYARWDCTSGASVVSCRADSNVAAPTYTYTWDSWSAWSECAGASCPGTQSRTASTCRRSPDNVVVADSFCGNNTQTRSCIGHEKETLPACALPPSNKYTCVNDIAVCGNGGWSSLGGGSCKNRNEDLCAVGGP